MDALERKLSLAIEELIDDVIELYPGLKRPLAKIQRVLRNIGGVVGSAGCGCVSPNQQSGSDCLQLLEDSLDDVFLSGKQGVWTAGMDVTKWCLVECGCLHDTPSRELFYNHLDEANLRRRHGTCQRQWDTLRD